MPRNGSGSYVAPTSSWNPAINGNLATSGDWQTLLNDIVTALTQSVSRDGQTPITGNLQMGNNKITGLSDGTGAGQAVSFAQLFNQGTEQDLASAATTDIGAQLTNFLRITGTTTITSFGTNYKGPRFLRFAGAVTLTNSSTLVLPGGANITTAAGDCCIVIPTATLGTADGWRVVAYQKNQIPADLQNQNYGFKNRIINGAMMIDQRNAGAAVTPNSGATYTVDRWALAAIYPGKFTIQQNAGSVTPPTGFSSYLGVTSSSAYTSLAADYFDLQQAIEANNFGDFNFGTAYASTVAVSFWVRSSLTGLLGGAFGNYAGTRAYPFTFTVNASNTWEYKTIIIPGDTSGTWVNSGTGGGAVLRFDLGNGSNGRAAAGAWTGTSNIYGPTGIQNVVGTSGATFYITGVQLEKGSTATSFDYRPYGTELALCQRYYWKFTSSTDYRMGVTSSIGSRTQSPPMSYPVVMRTIPTTSIVTQPPVIKLIRALDDTTGTSYTTLAATPLTTTDYLYTANASLSNASQILAFSFVSDFSAEL